MQINSPWSKPDKAASTISPASMTISAGMALPSIPERSLYLPVFNYTDKKGRSMTGLSAGARVSVHFQPVTVLVQEHLADALDLQQFIH